MHSMMDLLTRAQHGDPEALNTLLVRVRDRNARWISRRYSNSLFSPDELVSEFMIGVWRSVDKVRLDIGDPISFLVWKGQKAVARYVKASMRKAIFQVCISCGRKSAITRTACVYCGGVHFTTGTIEDTSVDITTFPSRIDAWQLAVEGIQVEEFRSILNGRLLELFDLLVLEGIGPGGSQNYLKEIADTWDVTNTCVAIYLRRLRKKIKDFIESPPPLRTR